jgi:hypothetical protein
MFHLELLCGPCALSIIPGRPAGRLVPIAQSARPVFLVFTPFPMASTALAAQIRNLDIQSLLLLNAVEKACAGRSHAHKRSVLDSLLGKHTPAQRAQTLSVFDGIRAEEINRRVAGMVARLQSNVLAALLSVSKRYAGRGKTFAQSQLELALQPFDWLQRARAREIFELTFR